MQIKNENVKEKLNIMERIILYGADQRGRNVYGFLRHKSMGGLVRCFVDKNAQDIKMLDGIQVLMLEDTLDWEFPYVLCIADSKIRFEVEDKLKKAGKCYYDDIFTYLKNIGEDIVALNRDYCAYYHIERMDSYFESAESENVINRFWQEDSAFYQMFKRLNLDNVIELACGRGRHVPMYEKYANAITLVDILEENIEMCRERFKDRNNIFYYCNNGVDLSGLPDNTYTSLFTYDAMVHFEMLDIASYLKEFYRVLKPGSYVLAHHSNNISDYRASFENAVGGRSFMSADVFAYLAYRSGFEIVEQKIIDWGVKDLDCISLLKK